MADTFTKQVLENGNRNYRALYTVIFSGVTPIVHYSAADPSVNGDMGVVIAGRTLYPLTHLKIWDLKYDMSASQALNIEWQATTDQTAWMANGQGSGGHSWKKQGGLFFPQSNGAPITGGTGGLLFTSVGAPAVGDFISIEMWLKKDFAQ